MQTPFQYNYLTSEFPASFCVCLLRFWHVYCMKCNVYMGIDQKTCEMWFVCNVSMQSQNMYLQTRFIFEDRSLKEVVTFKGSKQVHTFSDRRFSFMFSNLWSQKVNDLSFFISQATSLNEERKSHFLAQCANRAAFHFTNLQSQYIFVEALTKHQPTGLGQCSTFEDRFDISQSA